MTLSFLKIHHKNPYKYIYYFWIVLEPPSEEGVTLKKKSRRDVILSQHHFPN